MQHIRIMRMLLLMFVLASGCKDRTPQDGPMGTAKIVESPDDDFLHTRRAFQNQARARLAQLNDRVREMGDDATVHLRAQRDHLAMRVEQIDEQGEAKWDTFRAEVEDTFDTIERELGGY